LGALQLGQLAQARSTTYTYNTDPAF
jgi:hypothetical protein